MDYVLIRELMMFARRCQFINSFLQSGPVRGHNQCGCVRYKEMTVPQIDEHLEYLVEAGWLWLEDNSFVGVIIRPGESGYLDYLIHMSEAGAEAYEVLRHEFAFDSVRYRIDAHDLHPSLDGLVELVKAEIDARSGYWRKD